MENKKSKDFLFKYLNNFSPTGHEQSGQKIWMEYLKEYVDDFITDTYGTCVGVINPGKNYKVVIEAHSDEISWIVHHITKDGFIYVRRNGGSDHQIAPSKRVVIHTERGKVPAVFGWPAIHVREPGKEEAPSMKNIFLDCGCASAKEVEKLGVHIGCIVTFDDMLTELGKNFYCGRALDNRIGGFMIAQVARKIHEEKINLPYTLYIVNSVQEEVGLRGAEMIARKLRPQVAIITDVCHDTSTPMMNKIQQGDISCGKGPVLSYAPAVHNKLLDLIIDAAISSKIPFQRLAESRSTGTDTDAFAYANEGIPSALISLPLRYMHTTVEMAHKKDIDAVTKLITYSLKKIKYNHSFSYF